MHLEIRTTAPGKCPECDMPLVAANPAISEELQSADPESTPAQPKAGKRFDSRFLVTDPRTGQQVKQFQVMHDKLFHLFVIGQDLRQFQHIHPAFQSDGSFTIETQLPEPGNYKIYCDVYPLEGVPQVIIATKPDYGRLLARPVKLAGAACARLVADEDRRVGSGCAGER